MHLSVFKYQARLKKQYRYIALGILLGLSLFYFFRSCSSEILSKTDYTIGQDPRWLGLNVMGKERNLSAFNQQILTAIAQQHHFSIQLSITPHPLEELEEENVQGILTTLQPNSLNESHFIFSQPLYLTGPVLIIRSTASKDDWNEKRKKIVGIPVNSLLLPSLEADSSTEIKLYPDILAALADLRASRIDGAIFPVIPAYTYIQTFYKHEFKIVTLPLTEEGVRVVSLKNQNGELLIKAINEGLENLKQNGFYFDMLKRWGLINSEGISSDLPHK